MKPNQNLQNPGLNLAPKREFNPNILQKAQMPGQKQEKSPKKKQDPHASLEALSIKNNIL